MRTMVISPSGINTASLCAQQFQFSKLLRLSLTVNPKSLDRGSLGHLILEHYYRSKMAGKDNPTCFSEALTYGRIKGVESKLDSSDIELVISSARDYMEYYKGDPLIPLKVETPFSKVLFEPSDKEDPNALQILLEGKMDLWAKNLNSEVIVDHKFRSRNVYENDLSNQYMGYSWATGISTIIDNQVGLQKTLGIKERMVRKVYSYSKERLEEWRFDTIHLCHQIDYYVTKGYFPKNFTSCDKWSGCIFKRLCSSEKSDRPRKIEQNYIVRPEHDIFAENDDE